MQTWTINTREEFNEFKEYFIEDKISILHHTRVGDIFEVKLSDGDLYELPKQCEKWISENKPKVTKSKSQKEIEKHTEYLTNLPPKDLDTVIYKTKLKLDNEIQNINPVKIDSPENQYSNDLIFGKDKTENIVSIDVKDDTVHIFQETPDKIECTKIPMKYWVMSNVMPSGVFDKLEGNLHFKYLKEFGTKKEWQATLQKLWKIKADKYAAYNQSEAFMLRNGHTYFKGMKVEDVSILSFDIETNKTLDPNLLHSKTLMIANTFRKNGKITRKLFALDDFKNELEMIYTWCEWVREIDPSIMTGHNIYSFDLNYLHNRVRNLQKGNIVDFEYVKGLPIGRDGSLMEISKKVSQFRKDGSQSYDYHKCNIFGREIIDGFFLSIRYDIARNFPSYGLKPIIKYLELEKEGRIKWDFSKDDPNEIWDNINSGNPTDENLAKWVDYKEYCIDDADDSLTIFDLMIPTQFYWTSSCPRPFQTVLESATGSQVNGIMVRSYLQEKHSIPKPSEKAPFEGAISFGIPGVYKNCWKVDFSGLYPSIIRQYQIYDKKKDPNKHFLDMVNYFTEERLKNKILANDTGDKYYRDLEQTQKIGVNSMYGFMGGVGLHFNSPHNAAKITEYGRSLLEEIMVWFTSKGVDEWKQKINVKKD